MSTIAVSDGATQAVFFQRVAAMVAAKKNPSKFNHFKHLPDRASWLVSAWNGVVSQGVVEIR